MLLFIGVLQCLAVLRWHVASVLSVEDWTSSRKVQAVQKLWYWGTWLAGEMQVVCTKVVTSSSAAKPNSFRETKYFDFKRAIVFCWGRCLSKHKMAKHARNLGGHSFLAPPVCAYGCKKKGKKNSTYLMFNLPLTKNSQKRKTARHYRTSDEKQYC